MKTSQQKNNFAKYLADINKRVVYCKISPSRSVLHISAVRLSSGMSVQKRKKHSNIIQKELSMLQIFLCNPLSNCF
jgi:hypothetical protein